jgi:hypothetical protein
MIGGMELGLGRAWNDERFCFFFLLLGGLVLMSRCTHAVKKKQRRDDGIPLLLGQEINLNDMYILTQVTIYIITTKA